MKSPLKPLAAKPLAEPLHAVLEETARRIEEYEMAARDVADLCALATKTARLHKVPHAGMGHTALLPRENPRSRPQRRL